MKKESIKEPPKKKTHEEVTLLPFRPLPGFSSPHTQTVIACFTRGGIEPPSTQFIVPLDDENALSCEVSTPPNWHNTHKTVVLLHGLGGCHLSSYMVRFSRKLYQTGYRAVRINMRCCGSGKDLAKVPYHGGLSSDILAVLNMLKAEAPLSPIILIGFSLGGNIVLKLAAELGEKASELLHTTIAICPPVDLSETAHIMSQPINLLYNRYYMWQLESVSKEMTNGRTFANIYEFDEHVTAPNWGFDSPEHYYQMSSSRYLLPQIRHPCHILLTADDPFINHKTCLEAEHSADVRLWLSETGGHMGFFGWADDEHRYYWLDKLLLKWVKDDFTPIGQT